MRTDLPLLLACALFTPCTLEAQNVRLSNAATNPKAVLDGRSPKLKLAEMNPMPEQFPVSCREAATILESRLGTMTLRMRWGK